MARGFFENFPTMVYDNDGKGQYKEVVDIFRRVSLRNNLKNYIQLPLLENIDGTQKPERLANLVHGDPKRNWLVMMMNDVENLYTDWFMGEEEFYKYMLEKYPNKFIELASVYLDHDGDPDTPSIFQSFIPGERLDNNLGTVVRYDPTLKIIVYSDPITIVAENSLYDFGNVNEDGTSKGPEIIIGKTDSDFRGNSPPKGTWVLGDKFIEIGAPDISLGTNIIGLSSGSQATASTDGTVEIYAPHHESGEYKLTEGDPIVGTLKPDGINSYAIDDVYKLKTTNWDYEFDLNIAKSQVSILNNQYIDRIEDEFKKRIT